MTEKYIMFSLEDEESKKVAEILSNKTCKKILNLLAEKEASETDIARELGIPINTAEYNLKKLIQVGLVKKSKTFFWSTRGKKIPTYKAAKKHIIISPTAKPAKNIFIVALFSAIAAFIIKIYTSAKTITQTDFLAETTSKAGEVITKTAPEITASSPELWPWFLAGALFAILLILILNWKKL